MNPDEAGAILMLVDEQRTFIDQNDHTWVVVHKTASGGTAQEIATFFAHDPAMASTHYIVGQDGTIVQAVLEKDGAAGNCCLETGHASFLPLGINVNVKTISIEHVDPAPDNSTPLTSAQQAASFRLIRDICTRHSIPMRRGDASGGVIGHCDIAPLSRARCPGNYPWDALFTYLSNGGPSMNTVPAGWRDDGTTLIAPNGVYIQHGFRAYVLAHNWDPNNYPLGTEYSTELLEESNPSLGGGTQQVFRTTMLGYTPSRGVFEEWVGVELVQQRKLTAQYQDQAIALQKQLALPQPTSQPDPKLALYADALDQIATANQQIASAIAHVKQS